MRTTDPQNAQRALEIDGERLVTLTRFAADQGCSAATVLRRIRRGEVVARRVLGRVLIVVPATGAADRR